MSNTQIARVTHVPLVRFQSAIPLPHRHRGLLPQRRRPPAPRRRRRLSFSASDRHGSPLCGGGRPCRAHRVPCRVILGDSTPGSPSLERPPDSRGKQDTKQSSGRHTGTGSGSAYPAVQPRSSGRANEQPYSHARTFAEAHGPYSDSTRHPPPAAPPLPSPPHDNSTSTALPPKASAALLSP